MVRIDYDKVMEKRDKLNKLTDYIPICLHNFINEEEYFNRISRKVEMEYYKKRTGLQLTDDKKYLENDLREWLKKHPEFNDILIEE